MTDEDPVEALKAEFSDIASHCQRFCYAARAREHQAEAIAQLDDLRARAGHLKAEMAACEHEDYANQLLSLEETASALGSELRMWVALKDDDPNAAWDHLINAQSALRTAAQAHEIGSRLQPGIERLHALEELLFPPQIFSSIGAIVRHSECSICGMQYGDCDHLKGKAYMGKLCVEVIKEAELLEVSIVTQPGSKHCRVLFITDDSGRRDLMTWRLMPKDP